MFRAFRTKNKNIMITTAFLDVDYLEPKADSEYKGLVVSIDKHNNSKKKKIKFNTGNSIVDFYSYKKWLNENFEKENITFVTCSSSVGHFYMDSKKYTEKVVVFNNDYSDGEIMEWREAEKLGRDSDELVKVCVTNKFKTWKQLKDYVYAELDKKKRKRTN